MKVKAYAARNGFLSLRILNSSMETTVGARHVNHHLFLQVHLPAAIILAVVSRRKCFKELVGDQKMRRATEHTVHRNRLNES